MEYKVRWTLHGRLQVVRVELQEHFMLCGSTFLEIRRVSQESGCLLNRFPAFVSAENEHGKPKKQ